MMKAATLAVHAPVRTSAPASAPESGPDGPDADPVNCLPFSTLFFYHLSQRSTSHCAASRWWAFTNLFCNNTLTILVRFSPERYVTKWMVSESPCVPLASSAERFRYTTGCTEHVGLSFIPGEMPINFDGSGWMSNAPEKCKWVFR